MSASPYQTGPSPEKIRHLFADIADNYDKANNAMTFGFAHRWRRQLVRWSEVNVDSAVLDCATGTGDLAIEFASATKNLAKVIGTDFCKEMLSVAQGKVQTQGYNVKLFEADTLTLPFSDGEFDVVSIAYGIRNVADPLKGIREMARVLKPGGRLMVLETGRVASPFLREFFAFYFSKIVPRVGGLLTGQRGAYEYLSHSTKEFPAGSLFVELLQLSRSFSKIEYRTLMGGASFLYRATK